MHQPPTTPKKRPSHWGFTILLGLVGVAVEVVVIYLCVLTGWGTGVAIIWPVFVAAVYVLYFYSRHYYSEEEDRHEPHIFN